MCICATDAARYTLLLGRECSEEEEQGASELLVVALRFDNLEDGAVMRVKKIT